MYLGGPVKKITLNIFGQDLTDCKSNKFEFAIFCTGPEGFSEEEDLRPPWWGGYQEPSCWERGVLCGQQDLQCRLPLLPFLNPESHTIFVPCLVFLLCPDTHQLYQQHSLSCFDCRWRNECVDILDIYVFVFSYPCVSFLFSLIFSSLGDKQLGNLFCSFM